MPAANLCPTRDDYERLIHGELPPGDVERLSQHLSGCSVCADVIPTFVGEDTLLSVLRGAAADAPAGSEVPADLTQRLLALAARSPAGTVEVSSLLAPPQGPDEIGRLAHYRVLRVLGEGGMGVVFLAEDVRLGRAVALKTMKPQVAAEPRNRQRFLREARAAAKVEDDHIVPIYDVGEDRDVPWLAMPFLKGQTLDELLKRLKVLEPAQAARFGAQVATGLAAAHAAGLIHRDVKPANIWVDLGADGRARLLDFGLARDTRLELDGAEHLTRTGTVVGTPAFMAPEQARGEPLDGRADLFSLGCVLYRAVTGGLPFQGTGTMGTLLALATKTPPAPHEVNPAVPQPMSALIMSLLAKDRSARPASAAGVAAALEALQEKPRGPVPVAVPAPREQGSLRAEPTEIAEPPAPRRRRRLAVATLLLVLGGVLAAGIVVIIKDKNGKEVARVTVPEGGSAEVKKDGEGDRLKADSADVNADRRAAEWVLSIGGTAKVRLQQQETEVQADKELPPGPFELVGVTLDDKSKVDEAGLARLKGLTSLTWIDVHDAPVGDDGLGQLKGLTQLTGLYLGGTRVSNAGVEQLKGLTNLSMLWLDGTRVSDNGLAHLKGLTGLTDLGLSRTRVSDVGLAHLKGLTNLTGLNLANTSVTDVGVSRYLRRLTELTWLNLAETQVGDAGLENLKGLTKLTVLDLGATPVGDAGLEHIKGLTDLTELWLGSTSISDAGLEHLKRLTNLKKLVVDNTALTDAGLKHLTGLECLTELDLTGTRVTAGGVVALQKALPKCKIVSGPAGK
jgi:hypothetical protein